MRTSFFAVMVAVSMVLMVPSVAADDLAGASGQCFDSDGSGGNAHLAVSDSGEVSHDGLADADNADNNPPEGGAADALVALTDEDGSPEEGEGCTSEDADQQDYLEVHAGGAQVCYDGDVQTSEPGQANPCPTRP